MREWLMFEWWQNGIVLLCVTTYSEDNFQLLCGRSETRALRVIAGDQPWMS